MIDFIINNYYVILVVCILLIFAIIGYIIDTLKRRKYEEEQINRSDNYIPEKEIFIKKFETEVEEKETEGDNIDDLLNNYNKEQIDENS